MASPVKVGVNTLFMIPGRVGGTETYLRQTLRAIAENFSEFPLILFTNAENHNLLNADLKQHTQVHLIPCYLKARIRFLRILYEQSILPIAAKKHNIDVLWSPGYTAPAVSPCPQVVTIHDMQYKHHPEDFTVLARAITDILIKMEKHSVRRFITISEFSKSEIIKYVSIEKNKICVTHGAADDMLPLLPMGISRTGSFRKYIPSDERYLLTVANSYPHKNLHALVKAFGRILNRIPHRLVIVGKPSRGEALLKKSIANLPCPDRVIRLSGVNRMELIALYRKADLFVLPTLYEGFGLPILEAMICETPVIAAKRASIPEVGGNAVAYVEHPTPEALAEKILEVLGWEPSYRRHFISEAKQRALSFTWKNTAVKTMHCLLAAHKESRTLSPSYS